MYIPKQFKQEDKHVLIQAIKEIKFGALIFFAENRFFTSHIPFLVKQDADSILLECHVSKGNDIWQVGQIPPPAVTSSTSFKWQHWLETPFFKVGWATFQNYQ